jgi:HSP20 family protein
MASRFLTPFSGRGLLGRDPFLELHREVNRLFDDSLRGASQGSGSGALMSPSIDVCETEDGLEISAELPGVAEDDIDLRLDGDMLTISGEKRQQRKDDQNRFVERSYGSFTRSIQLPFTPDPDKVQADSDKGVLTIKLPRSVEQERSKRISIGSRGDRTIDAQPGKTNQSAIGKEWTKPESNSKDSSLADEKSEKGQGAQA